MTYAADGSPRLRLDRYYGRIIGWIDIVLPAGYLNRFQSGSIAHPGFAMGVPFHFFVAQKRYVDGGDISYGFIPPQVTFSGTTLQWAYTRTAATDFAHENFGDGANGMGPADGRLFYGVN